MLILTRREGESIMIGTDIVVTILGITKGSVRIGIAAPKETDILRDDAKAQTAKETE